MSAILAISTDKSEWILYYCTFFSNTPTLDTVWPVSWPVVTTYYNMWLLVSPRLSYVNIYTESVVLNFNGCEFFWAISSRIRPIIDVISNDFTSVLWWEHLLVSSDRDLNVSFRFIRAWSHTSFNTWLMIREYAFTQIIGKLLVNADICKTIKKRYYTTTF